MCSILRSAVARLTRGLPVPPWRPRTASPLRLLPLGPQTPSSPRWSPGTGCQKSILPARQRFSEGDMGTVRAEDAQRPPKQSHISPGIQVCEARRLAFPNPANPSSSLAWHVRRRMKVSELRGPLSSKLGACKDPISAAVFG